MSYPRSHYTGFPFDADASRDDFPFNSGISRDSQFQSTLNDLAKRHPELAGHFQNINQQRNRPAEDFKAKLRRPFGNQFPFDDDEDDDEDFDLDPRKYAHQFYNPQDFSSEGTSSYPEPREEKKDQPQQTEQQSSATQAPEKDKTGIQQSNTVDLGQRQEPIDERNQRSMSAPPGGENKKRYTSSINIPVNVPNEKMSQNQQQESRSNERIIPIQIEGRDDPVIPKNTHIPQSQTHQIPERIFGQRPEQFTRAAFPDEYFYRQNVPQHHQAPQQHHQAPQQHHHAPQQHHQASQQHHQTPQQHHQTPQQPQQESSEEDMPSSQKEVEQEEVKIPEKKILTPIEQIQEIQKDVSNLMEQVEKFAGKSRDKEYLYLDEMLTRNLIKLDNVDTQGQDTIRLARKEAIRCIQQAISLLENKSAVESIMETDDKIKPSEESSNMIEGDSEGISKEEEKVVEMPKEQEKIELSEENCTNELKDSDANNSELKDDITDKESSKINVAVEESKSELDGEASKTKKKVKKECTNN